MSGGDCLDATVRICKKRGLSISRKKRATPRRPVVDAMQNHLLAQLPMEMRQRWLPHLEFVHMPLGEVMYEAGDTLTHVYFSATSIVSLLYVMEIGASAEIAVVGNDGIVGVSIFMGGGSTPSRAVVQSAGNGYRLRVRFRFAWASCASAIEKVRRTSSAAWDWSYDRVVEYDLYVGGG